MGSIVQRDRASSSSSSFFFLKKAFGFSLGRKSHGDLKKPTQRRIIIIL
jgi:hypothetical protein